MEEEQLSLLQEPLLQVRKSRIEKNGSKGIEISDVNVEVSNGISGSNGHAIQSTVTVNGANKEEESTFGNDQKVEELDGVLENEEEYAEGQQKSENLVFYDKVEGVEFTSGEEQIEKNSGHGKLEILSQKFVVLNSSTSNENLQSSQVSVQGNSVSYKSSKEIESADDDLINVDELEETELDVERVLQKQTTHELYCPNCNSCITRRVILRKRKRRIQSSEEEGKRNKTETAVIFKSGIGSVQASEDEAHLHSGTDIGLEDDADHATGPDLFRCLSCFSFFIPAGNGFKLFRIFGDKSRKENIGDEQIPSRKKNWFASMFASNNQKTTVTEGSSFQADDGTRVPVVPLPNSGDKNGQKSSANPHASDILEGTAGNNATLKHKDKILLSPRHELSSNGMMIYGSGHRTEKTTAETNKEATQLLPTLVPVFKTSDLDGKFNISVAIPHGQQHVETKLLTESVAENINLNFRSSNDGQVHLTKVSQHSIVKAKFEGASVVQGKDTVITIDAPPAYEIEQDILLPEETASALPTSTQIGTVVYERTEVREDSKIEVIKSIVYGGLAESITSLSVVSSAAGGDVATLNILALGMANLIGGFFVICHNLWELRCDRIEQVNDQVSNQATEQKDRYKELLGQRENFILHAIVSLLSYLIFGLMPVIVYGFSFQKSDDKEFKLVAVAAASLLCIIVLAVGKVYVCRPPKDYLKTVVNFIILGFMASGISYAAGILVKSLLEKLGLFQSSSVANLILPEITPKNSAWTSY